MMNRDETESYMSGLPAIMRYILFLYVTYLFGRVSFILIMGSPNQTIGSSENFMKLSLIKKAASLIVGLPIYIMIEIIPQWTASLIQHSYKLLQAMFEYLKYCRGTLYTIWVPQLLYFFQSFQNHFEMEGEHSQN